MRVLANISGESAVRVFALAGAGGLAHLEDLALEPSVERVSSPRHASLLLIAGDVPADTQDALRRIHDQLPHPRASVYLGSPPAPLACAMCVAPGTPSIGVLQRLHSALLRGERCSEAALLPDEPPAPWRGRGEHGQGGDGMMGGKPYGRPMAMTGDDLRDGLALDQQNVSLGPFAPMLPPGLCLRLTLQGDVIQSASVTHGPCPDASVLQAYREALRMPVPIDRLERLRAEHHLRCVARVLAVRGMPALARRTVAVARRARAGDDSAIALLRRWLRVSGFERSIEPGLGRLDQGAQASLEGPALRATGVPHDLRSGQPAYRRMGFEPVTGSGGDVRARIRQWLDEASQSMRLAAAPGADRPVCLAGGVEAPPGPLLDAPASPALGKPSLNRLLRGLEWGQAMTVLWSFDVNSLSRMLAEQGC